MNFLSNLRPATPEKNKYELLHYRRNPFPIRGEVRPEVYVPRPELRELQATLVTFLTTPEPSGAFWAVEGERGVGKSNFLKHLELELADGERSGAVAGTAYRYIASQAVAPRFLVQEFLQALGVERLRDLVALRPQVTNSQAGTDLARFFAKAAEYQTAPEEAAEFLMRWLGGHQTYQSERETFGIWTRERLYPAISFPYLRTVTEMLVSVKLLERVVLLLDEFEDVQTLGRAAQTEYVQALKGLINSFNWSHLFVILAGQKGVFATIGEQYTSLPSRWTTVTLEPVDSANAAVELAKAYKAAARREYRPKKTKKDDEKLPFEPSKTDVEAAYGRLMASGRHSVRQRELLHELNRWVEERIARPSTP